MSEDLIVSPSRLDVGELARFIPEPKSTVMTGFKDVLQTVGNTFGSVLGGGQMGSDYAGLIQEQIRQQTQMQIVSLISNTEKSKHETAMTPLRNLSVR